MSDPVLEFFKALADESRLRIVGAIAEREMTGQELAGRLGLKAPTISHHLAVLDRLGLVRTRAEGTARWHALAPEALNRISRAVLEPGRLAPEAKPSFADRVMAAFVAHDGTLRSIPAARRKRAVILAWLMADFEAGRDYAEAEVNAILQRRHEDCATLRREFLGHAMMERRDGRWRVLPQEGWASG